MNISAFDLRGRRLSPALKCNCLNKNNQLKRSDLANAFQKKVTGTETNRGPARALAQVPEIWLNTESLMNVAWLS